MSSFLILALASSALAVPFAGEHGHYQHRQMHQQQHKHHFFASGVARPSGTGAPFDFGNSTGPYGPTGVAASTDIPVASDYATVSLYGDDPATESSSTSCTQSTVEVTTTNQVTVTITRSTSVAVATVTAEESTSTATLNARQNRTWRRKSSSTGSTDDGSASTSTSAVEAPSTSASAVAATSTSTSSTSVYVAPTTSAAVAASTTPSSAAKVTTTTASSGSSAGKRGVAYNDASLTTPFVGSSQVTWGYNWGQYSSGLSSSFNFVPLLWGTSSSFTSGWAAAVTSAIASGTTHLMSFNEPDLSSQSNLSPAAAAAAYMTYMQPYAGKVKLGSPAVTNGGGAMGLDWLAAFLVECSACTIDFVPIHWYDSYSNTGYFESHVTNASAVAGGRPVWVTEFGCTSGTDDQISGFLETVMPWMDSQSFVERYSYFMVADGLLVSGGATTSYGATYMNYV